MKRLFKYKYPKLTILLIAIIASYIIFSNFPSESFFKLSNLNYLGVFIAGLFFSFGFTSPFSAGFFITLNSENIFFLAMLGGIGAFIADSLIFSFIRFSFIDEFKRVEKTKTMKEIEKYTIKKLHHKARNYLLYCIAGIAIASPLPDELGIIMLAGLTKIKPIPFAIISVLLNSFGIFILLLI